MALHDVYGPMSPTTRATLQALRELSAQALDELRHEATTLPLGAKSTNSAIVRDALGHLLDDLRGPLSRDEVG